MLFKSLKNLMKLLWSFLGLLRKVIGMAGFLVVLVFLISLFSSRLPTIHNNSVLIVDPQGRLVDQLQGDAYERAVNEVFGEITSEVLVDDVVEALYYAKNDPRITLIVLRLDQLSGGGLSKLERIGIALDEVRESEKKNHCLCRLL